MGGTLVKWPGWMAVGAVVYAMAVPAHALDPSKTLDQYVHTVWNDERGLPQNSIQSALQTRDGYMWFGTQEGLARFDGVSFDIFTTRDGLLSLDVHALFEDQSGALWIGTSGGVNRYERGHFTDFTTKDGLGHHNVMTISGDDLGNVWIGTYGGGVSIYRDGKLSSLEGQKEVLGQKIRDLLKDSQGSMWIGTLGGGLKRYRDGVLTSVGAFKDVWTLQEGRDGSVWIGTNGEGLWRYDDGALTHIGTKHGLPDNNIRSILEDSDGNLWVGTRAGVVRRSPDGTFVGFPDEHILAGKNVGVVYQDAEGSLWVGTRATGLTQLRDGAFTTYGRAEGLSDDVILSLHGDDAGTLWIGTWGKGLNRYNDGVFESFMNQDGVSSKSILSVEIGRDGSLWFGTNGNGLYRYAGGVFETFRKKDGLTSNLIFALHEDAEGGLWIGTFGGGLNRYVDGRFESFGTDDGLPDTHIQAITSAEGGGLWIGTFSGGLAHFRDGKFTAYGKKQGLSNEDVAALYRDADGNLWVGTSGGGLNLYRDGKFTVFNEAVGLFNNVVYSVVEDDHGYLWMSCNKGIFRVRKRALLNYAAGATTRIKSKVFDTRDGMRSRECNGGFQPAAWKDTQGKLWFPTVRGVVVTDPSKIEPSGFLPPVVVEKVTADGTVVPMERPIELAPGTRKLEIEYAGLSFVKSEKMRFWYQLVGEDDTWVDAGDDRVSFYGNLASGRYTFKVKAANADGVWNPREAQVSFVLLPLYYQTLWFRVASVLLALGMIYTGTQVRLRRLRARQLILERKVEEQTSQIRDQKDAIEEVLGDIRVLARIGHQITSNLDMETILQAVYENAQKLMPVEVFGLALYDDRNDILDYKLVIEKGQRLAPTRIKIEGINNPGAWVVYHRKPLMMNDGEKDDRRMGFDVGRAIVGEVPESVLYYPLLVGESVIGALTVQSFRKNSYTQHHLDIMQTLANYTTVAIQNANAYSDIQQMQEMLKELDKQKTAFFQNVSHELRTPLTLIINPLTQLLQDEPASPEINMAVINSKRLLRLVNQLLEFQKIEAGMKTLSLSPINVVQFAVICGEYFESACKMKQVSFGITVDHLPLDPADTVNEAVFISGQVDALEKVVFNFLSNALKYTPAGGSVELAISATKDFVRLAVRDTGPGIPKDAQDNLFKVFSQVGTQQPLGYEGTGLGLALARDLTEAMNGEVGVESDEGEGSCFWAVFPRIDASDEYQETDFELKDWLLADNQEFALADSVQRAAPQQAEDASLVLVVDDNAGMRQVITRDLASVGYRSIEAPDGVTALKILDEYRPDIVISDWMMSPMSGPELIGEIKGNREFASVPVVLLTARSDDSSKQEGTSAGADAFLGKPFDSMQLLTVVRNLLLLKSRESELVQANVSLEGMLAKVKSLQVERIHAEKMVSLGHLVSGMLHELNNPISYMGQGTVQAKSDLAELRMILGQIKPPGDQGRKFMEIFDPIIERLDTFGDVMTDGATRVTNLTASLKSFARHDEAEVKPIHVQAGLESCLKLLSKDLGEIQVESDFQSVPPVTCRPAQINQLLFSLCMNAIEAARRTEGRSPQMTVRIAVQNDEYVCVEIEDNGPGIPEEIRDQVFDPFFTTKDVGEGPGLGLSVAASVARDHRGRISIDTGDWGTRVKVELPLESHLLP